MPLGSQLPLDVAALLEWPAFGWLGTAFYLCLALLVLEPVRLALRVLASRRQQPEPVPDTLPSDWTREPVLEEYVLD